MIYLPEEKQPKPYYTDRNYSVGTIDIKDGLVDITDPCYEKDTWCAIFEHKIKAYLAGGILLLIGGMDVILRYIWKIV